MIEIFLFSASQTHQTQNLIRKADKTEDANPFLGSLFLQFSSDFDGYMKRFLGRAANELLCKYHCPAHENIVKVRARYVINSRISCYKKPVPRMVYFETVL